MKLPHPSTTASPCGSSGASFNASFSLAEHACTMLSRWSKGALIVMVMDVKSPKAPAKSGKASWAALSPWVPWAGGSLEQSLGSTELVNSPLVMVTRPTSTPWPRKTYLPNNLNWSSNSPETSCSSTTLFHGLWRPPYAAASLAAQLEDTLFTSAGERASFSSISKVNAWNEKIDNSLWQRPEMGAQIAIYIQSGTTANKLTLGKYIDNPTRFLLTISLFLNFLN